jgi:hypothetical protein
LAGDPNRNNPAISARRAMNGAAGATAASVSERKMPLHMYTPECIRQSQDLPQQTERLVALLALSII